MTKARSTTYLIAETQRMERQRRLYEQHGHHVTFETKVHAREHALDTGNMAGEELSAQSHMRQHPYLDSPIYDGIDPNVNPAPPLNTDARREFDNAKRTQEMEKQLRLNNVPKFSPAPKPRPY